MSSHEGVPRRGTSIADRLFLALAAAASLVALGQVLGNRLIWDDVFLITDAEGLGDPDRLWAMLTSPFWQNSEYVADLLHDYWRPLTTLLLWLGGFLWGDWAPGFHLFSLLGAIGAAAAFHAVARRVVDDEHRPVAAWLALLFLIHPLAAEVICMAANVSDHLCFAFLALAVILFFDELSRGGGRWRLPLAGLFALLACASKELGVAAVGAPLAAWLLAKTRESELPVKRLARPQIWIAALLPVAAYVAARFAVARGAGHVETAWPGIGEYAWNVFLGLGQAFRQILVPIPGGANTYLEGGSPIPIATAAASWIAVVALFLWALKKRRAWTLPAVGLLLLLALLLPSLLSADRYDEALRFPTRYFHLPLAGALLAALPFAVRAWSRFLWLALPVSVGLLALLSWMRIDEWSDSVSFFRAEAVYHPTSAPDRLNLIRALTNASAYDEAEKEIDEFWSTEPGADPRFRAKALNDLAVIALMRDGDVERGSELLREALTIDPTDLANVLDLAAMRRTAGRPDQAVIVLENALDAPWFHDYRRRAIEERLERYRARSAESDAQQKADP